MMSIPALEFSTRRWLVAHRKRIVRRADEEKKNTTSREVLIYAH